MSIWTHVLGSIRFDGIIGMRPEPDAGIACNFEDDEEQWDKCNIPCGSEGSLIISKWTNPRDSSLARWTMTIFGDLRDYSDEQEVIDYFNRIVKDRSVRQGCFSFEIERHKPRMFVYIDKEVGFLETTIHLKEKNEH